MRNECLEQVITCPRPHILHMVKQSPNPETPTPEPSSILGPLGDGAGKFLGALRGPGSLRGAKLVLLDVLLLVFPTWGWLLRWRIVGISFSSLFSSLPVLEYWFKQMYCYFVEKLTGPGDTKWTSVIFSCLCHWEWAFCCFSFSQRCQELLMKPAPRW